MSVLIVMCDIESSQSLLWKKTELSNETRENPEKVSRGFPWNQTLFSNSLLNAGRKAADTAIRYE